MAALARRHQPVTWRPELTLCRLPPQSHNVDACLRFLDARGVNVQGLSAEAGSAPRSVFRTLRLQRSGSAACGPVGDHEGARCIVGGWSRRSRVNGSVSDTMFSCHTRAEEELKVSSDSLTARGSERGGKHCIMGSVPFEATR
ncbi:hypothetical protein EYF80_067036 [Liparis tanakae]|uniref:Uncharacterized protein n=1 Tax=Liparis tanakae TaxID=230148 RepID=A0A4Z2E294_9TELE|nr:hypothetical protein EYF80_067036 [Liparis tanakae]